MVKRRLKSRPVRVSGASSIPRDNSASESVDDEMFAALASVSQTPPVFTKVCRLCETKDGPFLNIFDSDKITAKRIDEVLPFTVAENDELPHKICFRCSAKVEELYEFILKCLKTQENLRTAMGKKTPLITKCRLRVKWETGLSKQNLSNEDICEASIRNAMKGIKDIPLTPLSSEEKENPQRSSVSKHVQNILESSLTWKKDQESAPVSSISKIIYQSDDSDDTDDVKLKQVKLSLEKCDNKIPLTRSSRSNKPETLVDGLEVPKKLKQSSSRKSQSKVEPPPIDNLANSKIKMKQNNDHNATTIVSNDKNNVKLDVAEIAEKPKEPPAKVPDPPPPINIMDHVSIIKVNKVGTLFLCKLCNRNFLQKELVLTHGCAKNNVPKDKFLHNHAPPREIPKPPTVKYIKMDKDFKKPVITSVMPPALPPIVPSVLPENKPVEKMTLSDATKVYIPVQPDIKAKPKIGPASRVRNLTRPAEVPKEPTPPVPIKPPLQDNKILPEVQFPTMPSLNSRYKLVPGPNNTFILVEDGPTKIKDSTPEPIHNPGPKPKSKKRKLMVNEENAINQLRPNAGPESSSEVIDLDNGSPEPEPVVTQQPYPVGLFQTAHHSGGFAPTIPKPPPFTTPAMKKQSYTIVQTGNPSKLLISTKPQPVVEEPLRKKSKKSKPDATESAEPYNTTVENSSQAKDAGFFTFINVDPLLQPSYVLPTNNIIQESQISTSTPASKVVVDNKEKDKYSCNMCEESFSREKKLLAHIQSHFNQMDEEDQLRREKSGPKKKNRKS